MGDYRFDESEWPDPDAMVAELRQLGVELMVSIWPTVSPLSENYGEFYERGLLVGADQGVEFQQIIEDKGMDTPMPVAFYDPTNPRTREYVWSLVKKNYLARGIRVFWLDACEPELNPAHPANLSLYAGPGAEVAGIYPRDNARLFADGMAAAGQEQTVLLCRSAWAGSQRYGAAVWSGDIPATWDSLRLQVRAGLSIAISGIPWWTTDIGGFHGGDPGDPAYQELIVRWFQYGVFCPLFRLHGDRNPRVPTGFAMTGGPNEAWSYGDAAYQRIAAALRLRERLRPYIHEQMRVASRDGVPPMRPLFVDFPEDPDAWQIEDEFLFGPDLLIAPVLEPGARVRDVYLPAGRAWIEAGTGDRHDGGSIVGGSPLPRPHSRLRHRRSRGTRCRPLSKGGPVRPSTSIWRPLGADEIRITGGMWGQKQRLNADTILEHCESWMERIGWIGNFDRAAAGIIGPAATRASSSSTPRSTSCSRPWRGNWAASPPTSSRAATRCWSSGWRRRRSRTGTCTPASGGPGSRPATRAWSRDTSCTASGISSRRPSPGCGPAMTISSRRSRAAWRITSTGSSARTAGWASAAIRKSRWRWSSSPARPGRRRYLELARLFVERRGTGTLGPHPLRPGVLPGRHPGPPGDDDAGPRRARSLPRRGRAGRGDRDRRRGPGGRGAAAVGERGGAPYLHHRRGRVASPGRGVRR